MARNGNAAAAEFQKFLDQIKSNGKLAELQKKWFGNEMKLPPSA